MLIKMLVGLSGPIYTLSPGDEYDFPDDEAIRLIEAEYAIPVAGQKIERAVKAPAPETRTAAGDGNDVVSGNGSNSASKRAGKRRGR